MGRGHVVMYGNADLLAEFGEACVGMPAREAFVGLPVAAFALMDTVLRGGRPLARWIRLGGGHWRMTVVPRVDLGTNEVYGVAMYLRRRGDQAGRHAPHEA